MYRYTTRHVLVSEWVDGRSPSQLLAAAQAPLMKQDRGRDDVAALEEKEQQRQSRRQILNLVRMGVQCSLAQVRRTVVFLQGTGCVFYRVPPATCSCW